MNRDQLTEVRDLLAEGMADKAARLLRTVVDGMTSDDIIARSRIRELQRDVVVQLNLMAAIRTASRRGDLSPDEQFRRSKQLNFALLDLADEAEAVSSRDAVIAAAPMPVAAIAMPAPSSHGLEKIWGRNNLQELAWLELGLIASRSVCRVVSPAGTGTGFMIGDGIVMTNNHVVPDIAAARKTKLEFNFEQDAAGGLKAVSGYRVGETSDFATSPVKALDCTLMRVVGGCEGTPPLSHWGALTLASAQTEVAIGDPVTIIQHPNGSQKKIAVTANEVVNIFGDRLHYMTATLPGSAALPCSTTAGR